MKSKVKENIGYIAIAIVVALTLVLSVVAIDTYKNKDIVANAQVELNGEIYSDIPISNFDFIYSYTFIANDYNIKPLYFQPLSGSIYYVSLYDNIDTYYGGFIHCINGYSSINIDSVSYFVLGTGSIYPLYSNTEYDSYYCMPIYFLYDSDNEFFAIAYTDFDGLLVFSDVIMTIYSVSLDDTTTTDSFLSLIGDGITFGFDSIATGITYTMDNLFIVDGELTNFSVVIFLMTGISLALAVLKFILNLVFSWRK